MDLVSQICHPFALELYGIENALKTAFIYGILKGPKQMGRVPQFTVELYGKLGRPYTGLEADSIYGARKGSQANDSGPTVVELYGKLGRPL